MTEIDKVEFYEEGDGISFSNLSITKLPDSGSPFGIQIRVKGPLDLGFENPRANCLVLEPVVETVEGKKNIVDISVYEAEIVEGRTVFLLDWQPTEKECRKILTRLMITKHAQIDIGDIRFAGMAEARREYYVKAATVLLKVFMGETFKPKEGASGTHLFLDNPAGQNLTELTVRFGKPVKGLIPKQIYEKKLFVDTGAARTTYIKEGDFYFDDVVLGRFYALKDDKILEIITAKGIGVVKLKKLFHDD